MKMLPSLLIFFLLIACNSLTEKKSPIAKTNEEKLIAFNAADSTSLIVSLYKNTVILKNLSIDSFSCSHTFSTITKRIEIKCNLQINKHSLSYNLVLTDTAGKYRKEDFDPSDEFRYDSSYLVLDDKKIFVTQLKYSNDSSSLISPVNVWYGKEFGPVAKYYVTSDKREIFLIRGINFYCNGTHCSNYKIFILQKFNDGHISVNCLDYPGNYPYSFENTFIFYPSGSSMPCIYMIKKGKTGEHISDFQIMPL